MAVYCLYDCSSFVKVFLPNCLYLTHPAVLILLYTVVIYFMAPEIIINALLYLSIM